MPIGSAPASRDRTPRLHPCAAAWAAFAFFVVAPMGVTAQSSECGPTIQGVDLDGTTLHYFDCGEGAPVIFVHGTTGDLRWAAPHAQALTGNFRAISYSRRYHHPNPAPEGGDEYSLSAHVTDLAALIEKLEIDPAHVVGHSYGAYVALALAVDRPHLVRSLVLGEPPVLPLLSHTSVGIALRDAWNARIRGPAQEAALEGRLDDALREFLDAVLYSGWFDALDPEARAALIREAGPAFRLELGTDVGTYMPPLACEDLSDLTKPTLLMTGEQSLPSLYLITAELERCLEGESHVMVPEAGHVVFANRPFFDDALLSFLLEH